MNLHEIHHKIRLKIELHNLYFRNEHLMFQSTVSRFEAHIHQTRLRSKIASLLKSKPLLDKN